MIIREMREKRELEVIMNKFEFGLYDIKRRTKGKTTKYSTQVTERAYIETEYGKTTQDIKFTKIALIVDNEVYCYEVLFGGHYDTDNFTFYELEEIYWNIGETFS